MRFAGQLFNDEAMSPVNPGDVAAAYNRREPFPIRNDIIRPMDQIPTRPILGPDGEDKFPGFEIRQVMPRASIEGAQLAQLTPSMMDELIRDEDEQELLDMGGIIPRSLEYDMGIIKTRPGAPQYYYERARPGGPF